MYWRLWFLLLPFALQAQSPGGVDGVVRSGGNPVPYAQVAIKGTYIGAMADSLGRYSVRQIPPGKHQLIVSSIGYLTIHRTVEVREGKITTLDISLTENTSELDAVVVTGTLREVTRPSSPIAIEVFSPTFLRKNPAPNIFESLSVVNGIQPQVNCNVCNTGDIHINGLEGPYTMILIDGMPIVSSLSTVYGLAGIPNSMVRRMEIVKGPASILYGSEAVGGVINIITKDPVSPGMSADVFATSYGEVNSDFSASWASGKTKAMVGVNYFDYSLPRDANGDNFTDITLQKRLSLFNKWHFNQRNNAYFSAAVRMVWEDRWGGEMNWQRDLRGSDQVYGESIVTNRLEVIAGQHWEKSHIDFSYNVHDQDSWYGLTRYAARQHVGFIQGRTYKTMGSHELLAGLPIRFTWYDDNTAGTPSASATWLPGAFVQDEWTINKQWTLLTGARYDHHNVHGDIGTGRISVKMSPSGRDVFRFTTGTGYRVVNLFTEEHAALTGSRQVVIRNALKPETSWNASLSWSRQFTWNTGFASVDASAFYTLFSNKIVGDFLTDSNLIIYDNLDGYAISRGITVNADIAVDEHVKVLSGLTWMDVFRVERDVRFPQLHAPAWSGTLGVSWRSERMGLTADLTSKITGPMYLPVLQNDYRPAMSPTYALVNLQLTKSFGALEIYGGVKNLLNFVPSDPLIRPFDPFDKNITVNNPNGYTFDTSYNYAPLQGAKSFIGVRVQF